MVSVHTSPFWNTWSCKTKKRKTYHHRDHCHVIMIINNNIMIINNNIIVHCHQHHHHHHHRRHHHRLHHRHDNHTQPHLPRHHDFYVIPSPSTHLNQWILSESLCHGGRVISVMTGPLAEHTPPSHSTCFRQSIHKVLSWLSVGVPLKNCKFPAFASLECKPWWNNGNPTHQL